MVSRVAPVTPPRRPPLGEGRMNACSDAASRVIRVLSPRMLPPVRLDVGSTASTATCRPSSTSRMPTASMNVDLPAPGTPVMPMRWAPPAAGRRRPTISAARRWWSSRRDSTSVIARPIVTRSPARTPST